MCWTFGCGHERWGHDPSKKHRKSGQVLSAIGSRTSQETLREHSMSRSPSEKKKSGGCDKLGSVSSISQTDVKSVHAGRGSEGHLSWYTAHGILRNTCAHSSHVVHTSYTFAYFAHIIAQHDEEHKGFRRGCYTLGMISSPK